MLHRTSSHDSVVGRSVPTIVRMVSDLIERQPASYEMKDIRRVPSIQRWNSTGPVQMTEDV